MSCLPARPPPPPPPLRAPRSIAERAVTGGQRREVAADGPMAYLFTVGPCQIVSNVPDVLDEAAYVLYGLPDLLTRGHS